jgi:hypothetical protein
LSIPQFRPAKFGIEHYLFTPIVPNCQTPTTMFYIMYLTGLCNRRHWPDPHFQTYRTRHGYTCTVRVNNREYTTDVEYETDELAKNAAATRAYMICRNFSVNDGMYPGQRAGQGGVIQGLPVAIGTGRRNTYSSNDYDSASSSGGTSPRSSDCGLDAAANPAIRRSSRSSASSASSATNCFCGRGTVRAYERCKSCLREAGYR